MVNIQPYVRYWRKRSTFTKFYTKPRGAELDFTRLQRNIAFSIVKLELQKNFLESCTRSNVIPNSMYRKNNIYEGKRRLKNGLVSCKKQIKHERDLLVRNFQEEKIPFSPQRLEIFLEIVEEQKQDTLNKIKNRHTEKLDKLKQKKNTRHHDNTESYPVFNLSAKIIPEQHLQLLRKYDQKTPVFGSKFDKIKALAEIDNLAQEIDTENVRLGKNVEEQEDSKKTIRRSAYSFIDHAKAEARKPAHSQLAKQARELRKFLQKNRLVILSPDKAKGHVIVPSSQAEAALTEHIAKNYAPVKKHHDDIIKYLDYREGRVRRALNKLRDASKDGRPTITAEEYRKANNSQSNAQSHVLTAKIHKFDFLTEAAHGQGEPIQTGDKPPGQLPTKFRFISPFSNSPSTKLGRFLGDLLKPLQNSGLRTVSIQQIVQDVNKNLQEDPLRDDETLISFDAVSMYDHLTVKLAMHCIRKRHAELEESTGRSIDLAALEECLDVCYEEGVLFSGKLYSQAGGAPTGHPISSVIQNVILSTYEQEIFQAHQQHGNLKIFQRWVDDIFCRLPCSLKEVVLNQLNEFDPDQRLQFTCELATQVEPNCFRLPFLDFQVEWATDQQGKQISCTTSVYRKATSSRSMKPFFDFGPTAWKTANLVWFLRRAVSHSSTRQIMHQEFEHLRQQFAAAGYSHSLISKKIQQTLEAMLGYGQQDRRDVPSQDENVSNRWIVLSLPWCGVQADKAIAKFRRLLPRDVCRISIPAS